VLFRAGVLLIVGMKVPDPSPSGSEGSGHSFHLVEREFGRFARAVRVNGAFDVAKAEARLADGELLIVLPKILDRRGAAHRISITSGPAPRS
jgi:HSP20 family molecular chaperone IbpA